MGVIVEHALGRELKFFVANEGTPGTQVVHAGTDAAKVLKTNFAFERERKNRADSRQTRSLLERITGKAGTPWDVEGYLLASGVAGTPPDAHELFKAVMGSYNNTPGTSDAYTLANAQAIELKTLQRHMGDEASEIIWGAWVDEMTITGSGGDDPKVKFSGAGMGHAHTGRSVTVGALAGAEVQITVLAAEQDNFEIGSVIQVGTSVGAGAVGHLVSAKVANLLTFAPAIVGAQAPGVAVIPFAPVETTAGAPTPGINGSLVLDTAGAIGYVSVTMPITGFEVTVRNMLKAFDDEAFQAFPTDVIPNYREVVGTMTFRARRDLIIGLGQRKLFTLHDIAIVLGVTAGSICTINLPTVELDFAPLDVPEEEECVITLPFTALGTATGEDEIDITFT